MEGETIKMGQTVTLDCQSYGGNPLATIIWYKNGRRIDNSYNTYSTKSRNRLRFVAAADDNNAAFRCEVSNLMLAAPYTAQIVMAVQCKLWLLCILLQSGIIVLVRSVDVSHIAHCSLGYWETLRLLKTFSLTPSYALNSCALTHVIHS